MSDANVSSWRCLVCGYIHHGAQPPEECPLCGAPRMDFEAYTDPAPKPAAAPQPPAAPEVRRWRCIVCGYIHEGTAPPEECPLCGAGADEFELLPELVAAPAAVPASAAAARSPERILVIGGGIAGISAVEAIRDAAPEAEITILSREPGLPYSRLNLTRYLAGEIEAAGLPLHPASWYAEQGINLLSGAEAESLDLGTLTVTLRDGLRLGCEKLILAAGAHAFLPPLPGIDLSGVSGLRTLEDAEAVLKACVPGTRVVIIGGGILGLEVAGGLARRGAAVTVLEGYGWLLPRQLNRRGGEILAAHVAILGVQLRPLAKTREITGNGDGRVGGVVLESGETLPAELVIVATGIRANTHLARQAGLTVGQGIVVDDRLQTSHPGVWAAGDAAEHRGVLYGLWGAAQYQGRIAGINAAGGEAEFGGLPRATTLKVLGVGMFSIGKIEAEDASYVEVEEEREGNYYRLLLHDGRLAGAILIGDTRGASSVKRAIDEGRDLSDYVIKKARASQVLEELGIAD